MERFGDIGPDGKPYPFHLYSMRQAIEEDFILDVLQNYTTYEAYYQLEKVIDADPEFEGRRAQRRVARYASLHPTAIDQKVEVIVEHFRRHVAMEIDGQAKAMVVTQSREHALRYWQHINNYIADKGINGLKALVAFSGDLQLEKGGETIPKLQSMGLQRQSCQASLTRTSIRYWSLRRNIRQASTNLNWLQCMLTDSLVDCRPFRPWRD